MTTILCSTAGAAKGNPGPAAAAAYITDASGTMISETAEIIGNSITQFAEYHAVMLGLQTLLKEFGGDTKTMKFELRLSNERVKQQLNGEAQITEPGLVPMFIEIHNLRVANFPALTWSLIPQAENAEANRLVSEALDAR